MSQSEFERGYIDCALWLAGREHDWGFFDLEDLPAGVREAQIQDCQSFYEEHEDLIRDNPQQAGHDFYLTRNRHGAGFWSGDWPQEAGKTLTESSHVYGTTDDLDFALNPNPPD